LFNCILSKYPSLLKSVLSFIGNHHASMSTGQAQLRICAEQSRYTRNAAKLYLIQYLSPYYGDQVQEKRELFASLTREYPDNPYFVFLENDEALTFYPDSLLLPRYVSRLTKRIPLLNRNGASCKRYVNLVKWQYSFIDTTVSPELAPSPIPAAEQFSYYPAYVSGLRAAYHINHDKALSASQKKYYRTIESNRLDAAQDLLDNSGMNSIRRELFGWHLQEGLDGK